MTPEVIEKLIEDSVELPWVFVEDDIQLCKILNSDGEIADFIDTPEAHLITVAVNILPELLALWKAAKETDFRKIKEDWWPDFGPISTALTALEEKK